MRHQAPLSIFASIRALIRCDEENGDREALRAALCAAKKGLGVGPQRQSPDTLACPVVVQGRTHAGVSAGCSVRCESVPSCPLVPFVVWLLHCPALAKARAPLARPDPRSSPIVIASAAMPCRPASLRPLGGVSPFAQGTFSLLTRPAFPPPARFSFVSLVSLVFRALPPRRHAHPHCFVPSPSCSSPFTRSPTSCSSKQHRHI